MSLYIEDYSERAIALFGDTKSFKGKIMEIGGKFNPSLKVTNSEDRRAGFIFPKTKRSVVQQLIDDVASGSIEAEAVEEKSTYSKSVPSSTSSRNTNSSVVEVSKSDFMNLLSKVERLEQEVNNLKKQLLGKSDIPSDKVSSKVSNKQKNKVEESESEEKDEEEDEMPKKRLLRRS